LGISSEKAELANMERRQRSDDVGLHNDELIMDLVVFLHKRMPFTFDKPKGVFSSDFD
jgi:hypothetical protein